MQKKIRIRQRTREERGYSRRKNIRKRSREKGAKEIEKTENASQTRRRERGEHEM